MTYSDDPAKRRKEVERDLDSLVNKLATAAAAIPGMLRDARELRALVSGAGNGEEDGSRTDDSS